MIIPVVEGRWEDLTVFHQAGSYGSIFPAVWSLMLALRSRGVGSSLARSSDNHATATAELLEIPEDFTQVALLPIGYYTGDTFKKAGRISAADRTHWDTW